MAANEKLLAKLAYERPAGRGKYRGEVGSPSQARRDTFTGPSDETLKFGSIFDMPRVATSPSGFPDGQAILVLLALLGAIAILLGLGLAKSRRDVAARAAGTQQLARDDRLDRPLLWWDESNAFTVRQLLNGGVLTLGRPGSSKTSASGIAIGRGIVADPRASLLILGAKPEDAQMWSRIFAEAGRSSDLLVVDGRSGGLRCNLINYVRQQGDDTRGIVKLVTTCGEVLRAGDSKASGEENQFFAATEERALHHTIEILKQAKDEVTAPDIQRFIVTAALKPEQLADAAWRQDFHCKCMQAAYERQKSSVEAHDFELAKEFWFTEWVNLADRSRSCVLAGILNTLFYCNSGIARSIISGETNVTPDDMLLRGKSILVNFPPAEFGSSGTLISTGFKFITQKAVLRRTFRPDDFYNVIWCDEAWQFLTDFDAQYAAQSRSHGGAMALLAQSRDSFYSAFKGESGKSKANALLGQFHHRIFHALGSPEDAEYAASLIGKHKDMACGGSLPPEEDLLSAMLGRSRMTSNFSEQFQYIVEPRVFMNGLRCGGPTSGYKADALIVRNGEPFSNGQNWLHVTFTQR